MANIISLQERVQGRYFDRSNFSQNYDRLPEESQQRVARMAIGFFHSQSCEYSIPDEVVRVILDNLADEYKALLLDMVNEQIVDGGKKVCQN